MISAGTQVLFPPVTCAFIMENFNKNQLREIGMFNTSVCQK